ncbi:hypothetical protein FA950_20770 [Bacillus thuringiensis]|uniref:hypothetical protein n=1 Tax=Bacillus thuringiensis TaxID=1428 RepID=UPI0010AD7099|nr:hypothetical protein [Bacillus thuringiensis]TKA02505.1 hypothetical protein FA950_20770 [Bacillus thuringiensis]
MFELLDDETKHIIAKRLTPIMLFILCMSGGSGFAGYWWTSSLSNEIHSIIAFYTWFIACIVAMIFGVVVLVKDSKIRVANPQEINS